MLFHRFCVKKKSPGRTTLGGSVVKSTIVEAARRRTPASAIPPTPAAISFGKLDGSCAGGSPLLFALVDARGPVEAMNRRSQRRAGILTATVGPSAAGSGLARGTIAVRGAGQMFSRKDRCRTLSSTPRSRSWSTLEANTGSDFSVLRPLSSKIRSTADGLVATA